ncbi:hypothetical protein QL996_05035 [Planococcus sp. APC 4015]|nr:hypothetical protein [Planococcus sp. APC 4015]
MALMDEADQPPQYWWDGQSGQRFWMEIAGAKAPGIDLRAPIRSRAIV